MAVGGTPPIPVLSESVLSESVLVAEATPASLFFCNFTQHGDYVHISSTPPATSSGHGWWENIDCKATKAVITVELQVKKNGAWVTVATGTKTVGPGGGSSNRAVGRALCADRAPNWWRSVIDVDLVDTADAADAGNKLTTPETVVACGA